MNKGQRNTLSLTAIQGQLMPEEETYQARLRTEAIGGIKPADVAAVVQQITEKAKAGDVQAQKLFFDYLLGAKTKPTTIEIHNHYPDVHQAGRQIEANARAAAQAKRLNGTQQPSGADE